MTGRFWPAFDGIALRLLLLLLVAEGPLLVFTVSLALQNDHLQAKDALSRTSISQSSALATLSANLLAADGIATAAASLPPPLITDKSECDKLLAGLIEANGHHVAAIALHQADGQPICATRGGEHVSAPAPLDGIQLIEPGHQLAVVLALQPPRHGTVTVILAPPSDRGNGPFLWVSTAHGTIPVGIAPSSGLPGETITGKAPSQSRRRSQDGRPFLYSTSQMPNGIGAPGDELIAGSDVRKAASASARTFLLRIAQLAGFFLAESVLIGTGVSLVASQPLRRLNEAVDRWRSQGRFSGISPAAEPVEVRILALSFAQATESLDQRERELKASIAQQELLMQEIHHRVKNNLQIIASLLNLQAARIKAPDARAEFQSARDRVRALATLHRHLYAQGDLHLIDMRAFFAELCSQLFQALDEIQGDRITMEIVAPDVNVSSDQAVPIALIVTETVGNAIKYAFPDGRRGRIQVLFETAGTDRAVLTVRDDGIGLEQRPDGSAAEGLGLQLVRGFARQLGAQLTISTEAGTCYRLHMAIEKQRMNTIALGKAARATTS